MEVVWNLRNPEYFVKRIYFALETLKYLLPSIDMKNLFIPSCNKFEIKNKLFLLLKI